MPNRLPHDTCAADWLRRLADWMEHQPDVVWYVNLDPPTVTLHSLKDLKRVFPGAEATCTEDATSTLYSLSSAGITFQARVYRSEPESPKRMTRVIL